MSGEAGRRSRQADQRWVGAGGREGAQALGGREADLGSALLGLRTLGPGGDGKLFVERRWREQPGGSQESPGGNSRTLPDPREQRGERGAAGMCPGADGRGRGPAPGHRAVRAAPGTPDPAGCQPESPPGGAWLPRNPAGPCGGELAPGVGDTIFPGAEATVPGAASPLGPREPSKPEAALSHANTSRGSMAGTEKLLSTPVP